MPEYVAPDVYVEEDLLRPPRIEGLRSDRAGFVGPTLSGDVGVPTAVESFAEFVRAFGDASPLPAAGAGAPPAPNYVALAARSFFENGGERLYVTRTPPPAASSAEAAGDVASALAALEGVDEVSTVAAPGAGGRRWAPSAADPSERAAAVAKELIAHAEKTRYRLALIDPPDGITMAEVLDFRRRFDSARAALYYPWVLALAPGRPDTSPVALPPSGFIAGVYARVDRERGPSKAPANEPLRGTSGLETQIDVRQQGPLNAEGVNCLRTLPGRGHLVWGTRTAGADPEWKYVPVRRYFSYLEHSLDRGTRWAAFEPNAEPLWEKVRGAVEDFLFGEWTRGALTGGEAGAGIFRPLRPLDDDAGGRRLRPPRLPRRRGTPQAGRVPHLPPQPEDGVTLAPARHPASYAATPAAC